MFDILNSVHKSIGHGGRDCMLFELNKKYKNITQADVKLYLDLCILCQEKKKSQKKDIVVKPMVFNDFNSQCQIDLIDFQSQPDRDFKFICVYQYHLTKFCILKPLTSKRAEQVACVLLDIFCLFGAPDSLQSDNGREFCNELINSLRETCPDLNIVHGKPWHSQSQGSVERANQDIENILTTWMQDNNTNKWSEGLSFVQFMKNSAYHSGIKQSPYNAMFGTDPKTGLTSSILPHTILQEIPSIENRKRKQTEERQNARDNLEIQAKKMKNLSNAKFPEAKEGSTVQLKIPNIDRGRGDPRSVIAVVLKITEDGFYQLGCKSGILKQLYARSQFTTCSENLISLSDIPQEKEISLRSAATEQSIGNGQGFFKCTCITKCTTNRCICRKNGVLCNSKCHHNQACTNFDK
eukprot:XP_016660457.1 PREDICTED: KRAB-A domain-containing protein 2-like [Acyrthosiphon pisum]